MSEFGSEPDAGLERRVQHIAERYAPAYVVIDENFQILHFSGRTGRYIGPIAGAATLDLLSLVHSELRLDLRMALGRALDTNEAAHAEQVQLGPNGHRMLVDISVEPIQDGAGGHRHFVVLFKDSPVGVVDNEENNPNAPVSAEHVEQVESELRATRERVQATNEKLKSFNEEYQSLNEELQSVNEELATANRELAHRGQELARAETRQRLLLTELQHRVRNTLGVVRSIARRSAETSSSVDEYAAHLDGRLNAFARTQALVTRDPEGGVDLEYLVIEELLGYNAREGEQLRVSGPQVRFQSKAAETFALALHELATNALKYGALSQPSGRIEISWRIDEGVDPPRLVFDWRERNGPSVMPPPRKGFGTELLERTLAFEFKGQTTMMYNAGGLHCTIIIPLSRRTIHTPAVGS